MKVDLEIVDDLRRRAFIKHADGSAIIEVAIMAPLLALLLVGTIEVGTYMYDGIEVGNAARAGVQYGAQSLGLSGDYAGIESAAQHDANEIALATTDIAPSTYCTCDSNHASTVSCTGTSPCAASDPRDTFVKVTVTKQFVPFLTFPGIANPLTIAKIAIQQVSP